MAHNGERNYVLDNRHDVDQLSAVGGWVKRWIHWGDRGTVLLHEEGNYIGLHFILCTEEKIYARRRGGNCQG